MRIFAVSDAAKTDVKLEESISSVENLNIEIDVKMEVDAFDAFDSVESLMQTETETEHVPMPPVKQSKYKLRSNCSTIVKDVQPKIESVFLEDGEFQAATDIVDFSIDGIKSESESEDEDQDVDDCQSDKNDNAGETGEAVEVKIYKKKRQHCPKCSMSYSKREYLSKHMEKEHNSVLEKKRPGKRCDFFVADPNDPRPYKCDQCDKKYMRSKHLARHRRTHSEEKRCQQCNEKYRNYERHMLKKHGIECVLPATASDVADIPFANIKNERDSIDGNRHPKLDVNLSKTVQDNPPKVEMEPQEMSNQDQSESDEANENDNDDSMLKIKLKRKNEKLNDESNRCIPCNRKFTDMSKHWVQYHSGIERPFECYVCHRNYKRFEHIKYHLRTHGDEKNYQCHVCGDSFFLSNELRKHIMYRHQVERPFKCTHPQCKKSFKNMHALNVHSRTHSGAKPFRCKHSYDGVVCLEAFAALSSLRIHERKHTGEKVTSIEFCNFLHFNLIPVSRFYQPAIRLPIL